METAFHPVQNICFTRGDHLWQSFVYANQSTWKNFDSFSSQHKSFSQQHKSFGQQHKFVGQQHKFVGQQHKSVG
ncbi:hypothetical protein VF14_34375 [Nostoc linckia z18]|uniref:Uncharacterized protein n=2 Tax=Nostoc linckia TaxID=92942 RepID=A0A9Q5Z4K3_NOSLI|nr:hypothetical protein [Nostoc linckia]PHJ67026.1 hypothetical protein VF02_06900 [Nostoc linckia z1]PHJ67756.1 hypothetical protein VF05_17225 [Nostoc linckia z3]PHJ78166.1 hypothetical protein VF06_28775 [Nostoc linckia z4]PHJ89866.1 hypothetical protein VF04_31695 [Nostoc linckia z7]PHK01510.1 hypothetical protein VF09_33090 [Nostoc linckia z9]PHK31207.1 hypothetical protein VF12_28440 [Nostoc linckia z15]